MPELPEVETVARQLAPQLTHRRLKRLVIHDDRLRNGRVPPLGGRRIEAVSRSGKQVLVELSPRPSGGAPLWLAVHLRMTGRLMWVPRVTAEHRSHLRANLTLDRGNLLFVDTRRFGTWTWYPSAEAAAPDAVDPLDPALTPAGWESLIRGSRQAIKIWLLRQDRLVGLGNIYASEILYAARVSPDREAASLDRAELSRMHRATRRILRRAIDNCGTTFSDFQDARGVEGSYQQYLAVYGREGERCRRCGGTIERSVQAQRSTFFCAGCQD